MVDAEIIGNPDYEIHVASKIEEANAETISFLANEKYIDVLLTVQIGALLISKHIYNIIKDKKLINYRLSLLLLTLNYNPVFNKCCFYI